MEKEKKLDLTRRREGIGTINNPTQAPDELLATIKTHDNTRYCVFQHEQGKQNKTPHFQGYIELKQPKSIKKLNEELFENKAHIEKRFGSQEQAIAYVTDKKKNLLNERTFEHGKPKIDYSAVNKENEELPDSGQEQGVHLDRMIETGHYTTLGEVKRDYPYLVIRHAKEIQEIIHHHQRLDGYGITPAEVIGIWGASGQGKSCYTDQLLRKMGYPGTTITYLKSDKVNHLGFELKDEENKVLVIEEVRPQGPKYNSLLNGIDRKSSLPVKGSHIRNNFELIVVNSLGNPYSLFLEAEIPQRNIIEPLRRIYDGKVLKITRDEMLYQSLKKQLEERKITKVEFKFKLIPHVEDQSKQIPEVLTVAKGKKLFPRKLEERKIVWLYGKAGSGKSWGNREIITGAGWEAKDIEFVHPIAMTGEKGTDFRPEKSKAKVIVLEQVDRSFATYEKLDYLLNKEGLIIINSLYKPEEVFGDISKKKENLKPYLYCLAYEIKENKEQLEETKRRGSYLSETEFQEWYKPIVREITNEEATS